MFTSFEQMSVVIMTRNTLKSILRHQFLLAINEHSFELLKVFSQLPYAFTAFQLPTKMQIQVFNAQ